MTSTFVWCGRQGTWGTGLAGAGVALADIHLRFAQLGHWAGSGGALGRALLARGGAPLSGAGVALGNIHLRFAWQVWHLVYVCFAWQAWGRRATLRGRRGTWRHSPSFCMAGVALGDIHLRFAWQAWHLGHWAGSDGALGCTFVTRGAAPLCEAGVALGDIHLRFAWQARHPPSFCVAGVHLVTSTFVSRGWHGTELVAAGAALADINFVSRTCGTGLALVARLVCSPRHFAGQAWHLATSTFALRGKHDLLGGCSFRVAGVALGAVGWVWWRALVARGAAPLCVAGVALGDIHLRFSWQVWHLVTSTFVSHGRCGTC